MTLDQLDGVRADANTALDEDFLLEVWHGLSLPQKALPSRFFYDARGSALFEEITGLPEYYPARVEIELLKANGREIGSLIPEGAAIVEFGSGSSRKTELLLQALTKPAAYIPIEISSAALLPAAGRIQEAFPDIAVRPVLGGFHDLDRLQLPLAGSRNVGFFPGSTIGNFEDLEAVEFLGAARRLLGGDALFLIGADLTKPLDILLPAYNDPGGVTAAFNLNMLARINRELGANFDLTAFAHEAIFNEVKSRIEMHLRALRAQKVNVRGRLFSFSNGETVHTENSRKYSIAGFQAIARKGGWRRIKTWVDAKNLFSLHFLG